MHINFTLGVDVDADQLAGLFTWLEETYHQVDVTVTVPEFVDDVAADAVTETGPFHPLVLAVQDASESTDQYTMCKCGHTDHVHTVSAGLGCIVDGCNCENFDQIVVNWQTDGEM